MHVPWFHQSSLYPPHKSGLPVLSMLLLFDTMSRTTASKPQGVWQGNEKGISTADALKDDLRTQSQEEGHKKFIASHFQKVELKVGCFFHGFYQLRIPSLILGGYS